MEGQSNLACLELAIISLTGPRRVSGVASNAASDVPVSVHIHDKVT